MKKYLSLFLLALVTLGLSGCIEEPELKFRTVYVSDSESVRLVYDSPDPWCLGMMYSIAANYEQSSITIKCTNANSVYIDDNDGANPSELVSERGKWRAEITDKNKVTFYFDAVSPNQDDLSEDEIYYGLRDGITIATNAKTGKRSTYISVERYRPYSPTEEIPELQD